MTDLIYLDTETTGLEPEKHEVWEIAWAVNEGIIERRVLPHSLKTADPKALELNGYLARNPSGMQPDGPVTDVHIKNVLAGNTLVCANPTFDRMMLRARWGHEPWHYRSIDIESVALGVLGYERPKGMKGIRDDLVAIGYDIPEPDHSAFVDVQVLRMCHKALINERNSYGKKV